MLYPLFDKFVFLWMLVIWISRDLIDWYNPFYIERQAIRRRIRTSSSARMCRSIRKFLIAGIMYGYAAKRADLGGLWLALSGMAVFGIFGSAVLVVVFSVPDLRDKMGTYTPPSETELRDQIRLKRTYPPIGLAIIICWIYAWRHLFLMPGA